MFCTADGRMAGWTPNSIGFQNGSGLEVEDNLSGTPSVLAAAIPNPSLPAIVGFQGNTVFANYDPVITIDRPICGGTFLAASANTGFNASFAFDWVRTRPAPPAGIMPRVVLLGANQILNVPAEERNMHDTSPRITSVTPIIPQPDQIIIIDGQGLGTHSPFTDQNTPCLAIRDKTGGWEAGLSTPRKTDAVTLSSALWVDNEIIVTAFAGKYGAGNPKLNPGDHIEVAVWNAQSGAGPATYDLTVNGPPQGLTPPSIRLFRPQVSGLSALINGVTLPTTPGATIVSITWTFGDGTPSVISWFPVKHRFEHSGTFVVTAVSADSNGRTASASTTVAVSPKAHH